MSEYLTEDLPGEGDDDWEDIEIDGVAQIILTISVTDAQSLGEVMDIASITLMRKGIDYFNVLVTEEDSDRKWLIHEGEMVDVQAVRVEAENLRQEQLAALLRDDDPVDETDDDEGPGLREHLSAQLPDDEEDAEDTRLGDTGDPDDSND